MTNYVGYDGAMYFITVSLRAIALGAAITLAKDVLPGSAQARAVTHWIIVSMWIVATLWANLSLHDYVGLRPRVANIFIEVYLIVLLLLHSLLGPWNTAAHRD